MAALQPAQMLNIDIPINPATIQPLNFGQIGNIQGILDNVRQRIAALAGQNQLQANAFQGIRDRVHAVGIKFNILIVLIYRYAAVMNSMRQLLAQLNAGIDQAQPAINEQLVALEQQAAGFQGQIDNAIGPIMEELDALNAIQLNAHLPDGYPEAPDGMDTGPMDWGAGPGGGPGGGILQGMQAQGAVNPENLPIPPQNIQSRLLPPEPPLEGENGGGGRNMVAQQRGISPGMVRERVNKINGQNPLGFGSSTSRFQSQNPNASTQNTNASSETTKVVSALFSSLDLSPSNTRDENFNIIKTTLDNASRSTSQTEKNALAVFANSDQVSNNIKNKLDPLKRNDKFITWDANGQAVESTLNLTPQDIDNLRKYAKTLLTQSYANNSRGGRKNKTRRGRKNRRNTKKYGGYKYSSNILTRKNKKRSGSSSKSRSSSKSSRKSSM